MTLNRTIAVGILAFAVLGAPASAGTLDDAVSADARGDYAKALRPIRPAANDGDAAAQFYLGTMYVTGHGVQQDYSAAALWFRKAAEQGYVLAQTNLGVLYRDGRGVTRDETEAEARTRLEAGYTTTFSLENFIRMSQKCANRQHRASV
jgi:TPR repeat protein